MYNPPHPGESIREDILPALGIAVAELARKLQFSERELTAVIACRAPISPALAQKLEVHGYGRAELWLDLQAAWDKWQGLRKPDGS